MYMYVYICSCMCTYFLSDGMSKQVYPANPAVPTQGRVQSYTGQPVHTLGSYPGQSAPMAGGYQHSAMGHSVAKPPPNIAAPYPSPSQVRIYIRICTCIYMYIHICMYTYKYVRIIVYSCTCT